HRHGRRPRRARRAVGAHGPRPARGRAPAHSPPPRPDQSARGAPPEPRRLRVLRRPACRAAHRSGALRGRARGDGARRDGGGRAEPAAAARDGADRVRVDWDALPAVTTAATAVATGSPALYPERPGNVCVDSRVGDPDATDAAFARAAPVVSLATRINRVTGVPLEPRTALASYDEAVGRYTLYAGSGGVQ